MLELANQPEKMGLAYEPETLMTNFDHSINEELGERLKEGKTYAQYSGYNFCGYVWWAPTVQTFNCEV